MLWYPDEIFPLKYCDASNRIEITFRVIYHMDEMSPAYHNSAKCKYDE